MQNQVFLNEQKSQTNSPYIGLSCSQQCFLQTEVDCGGKKRKREACLEQQTNGKCEISTVTKSFKTSPKNLSVLLLCVKTKTL